MSTPTRLVPQSFPRWIWISFAAALLVVLGTAGSLVGASSVSHNDAQRSQQALVTSSMEIAATLKLAIQQEDGLAVSAEAFIIANPNVTNAQFLGWVSAMGVTTRFPELGGLGFFSVVRAAQLSAFIARVTADPPQPLVPGTPFAVNPAGIRPLYCLAELEFHTAGTSLPLGYDVCAGHSAAQLAASFDRGDYVPFEVNNKDYLGFEAPVYARAVVPATASARLSSVLGIVGMTTLPSFDLNQALKGHPGTAVAFDYGLGATKVSFRAGSAPAGARSTTVSLHDGWNVEVAALAEGPGVFANENSLALLLGGFVLSLLLGSLIFSLGTSRSRALRLVGERTQELHHLALYDSLTELPNRALILDRIEQMLARSRRENSPLAVLFLDLDNFKDVNDSLGHAAGDDLLVAVGARLAGAIRQQDAVGRLGGDEFVVVVGGVSLAEGTTAVATRILEVMAAPFSIGSTNALLDVTVSIGIAEGWRDTPDELLRDADIALYQAKAAGKNRAVNFAPAMHAAANDSRTLHAALHAAYLNSEFFLLYQPTFDLVSGAMAGVEALLRWRHPTRGVIQPDVFIPALEANGLIGPVGRWVVEEACRQGALWQKRGHHITVSMNVSAQQLDRDQFVDDVRDALLASGFDPSLCILELTETTMMHDVEETMHRLTLLKALGLRLAIDDFGTGYSSLAYLRQFPIDVLKIGQSFVSEIADTSEAAALVHAMVQLGKALGLETVAEGVETEAQRAQLTAEKVDLAQGFLFARPLDAEAIDRLLREGAPNGAMESVAHGGRR